MTDIVKLAIKIKNLSELHLGIIDKTIIIYEKKLNGDRNNVEIINDKRLNDLIYELHKEALIEMRDICPDINGR